MNKVIIVLGGTPRGKTEFQRILMNAAWVWNINPKNKLAGLAEKELFWKGERTEEFYKALNALAHIANTAWGFEKNHVLEKIESFLSDPDEQKTKDGINFFSKFVMVIHGITAELAKTLKEEYGAFSLYISEKSLNTQYKDDADRKKIEDRYDHILYEDDTQFSLNVENVIDILTKEREGV